MKFIFEADMKKGQCSACPLLGWSELRSEYMCELTRDLIPLEVEPNECPLVEESEVKQ